jgi:hypothetical protein
MISSVEALNFRCFRYINQMIRPFNVLVGPNASGKTTFLDAIAFIGDVIAQGPDYAIKRRTDNIFDLFWGHHGNSFELAVEAIIPGEVKDKLVPPLYEIVRYELQVGIHPTTQEAGILGERVFLKNNDSVSPSQKSLFPEAVSPPVGIYDPGEKFHNAKTIIHKVPGKNDNYYSEVIAGKGKGWLPSFKFGIKKSALGNLPDDGRRFPVSTWFRQYLSESVHELTLNSLLIRKPSPPGQPQNFKPDGSNLPWVVENLRRGNPKSFASWIEHVRTALPDIADVQTIEREEDRTRYLNLKYSDGVEVPSWMVSDGTLRFLALTLLAYLQDFRGTYLIEEPENGLHPKIIEPLFQSLSSVYDAQVVLATHSPVMLGLVDLENVLCFAKCDGATDIVSGPLHPALRDWHSEASLGMLFAAGVLG